MTQEQPDPLTLDPRWHVDCRIEAELPEDKVIGKRFIIHAAFVAAALSAVRLRNPHASIQITPL